MALTASQEIDRPDAAILRTFRAFSHLDDAILKRVAMQSEVLSLPARQQLLALNSTDDYQYFLIAGTLLLTAADGRTVRLEAGTPSARQPVAQLQPRRYNVVTQTRVHYIRVPAAILSRLHKLLQGDADSDCITLEDESDSDSALTNTVSYELYRAIQSDSLVLPSLPDIAQKVGIAVRHPSTDANKLAMVIQADPVISAKLIKTANSAMYAGQGQSNTLSGAIVKLGLHTTQALVVTFAIRELYRTRSSLLSAHMTRLMQHSVRVAAIAHVLCKCCDVKVDPEEALLAGLVHNIGGVAILDYVRRFPEVLEDTSQLAGTMKALMGESSSLILKKWDFSDDFIDAALHASDWNHSHDGEPKLVDIVLIAHMHSLIGSRELNGKPRMDELPAYQKLELDGLTPHASLRLLDDAKQEIQITQTLLMNGG